MAGFVAPVAVIDRIDNLSQVERFGAIRSLTRKARVLITPGPTGNPGDYSVLNLALSVLPDPFSLLDDPAYTSVQGYAALALIERSPAISEDDPCCVDVILKYEHLLDGPNQLFSGLSGGAGENPDTLYGRGRASIVEKKTNFYYPNGDASNPKTQILVGYVFPASDVSAMPQTLGWWNTSFGKYAAVQGGEVTIPFPQSNYSLSGIVNNVVDPWVIVYGILAAINEKSWAHKPPQCWICSEVRFEVTDPGQTIYRFDFEFQFNLDTWNPTTVFIDQRTGKPPAAVKPATDPDPGTGALKIISYQKNPNGGVLPAGYWTVPALKTVDYDAFFQQLFESPGVPVID